MSESCDKIIDQAVEEAVATGNYNKTVTCTLYHGFRSKKTPEQIKNEGLDTYQSQDQPYADYLAILQELGVPVPKREEQIFEFAQAEGRTDPSCRWNFWATIYEDSACRWAKLGPEVVQLAVERAQKAAKGYDYRYNEEDEKKMQDAITERFGEPMKAAIQVEIPVAAFVSNPANICIHKNHISPNEIVSVERCPV